MAKVRPTLRYKHLNFSCRYCEQTLHGTLHNNLKALSYGIPQSIIIDSRFAMCTVVQQPLSPDVNSGA